MEEQRVQKFISKSGYCSRRRAEIFIEKEAVTVNGKIIKLGDKCLPTDKIMVNDDLIEFDLNDNVYYVLNKQYGFITSNSDEFNRRTVFDSISDKDYKDNLFSVGRLDKDTEGLLIITNDGDFSQSIIHPSQSIIKEYIVTIDKQLSQKDKKTIEMGIVLDDRKLAPCNVKHIVDNKYSVKISEGRKRQVRRMFEEFGYKIYGLKRIKIGNMDLKELNIQVGKYKKYNREELENMIFSKHNTKKNHNLNNNDYNKRKSYDNKNSYKNNANKKSKYSNKKRD